MILTISLGRITHSLLEEAGDLFCSCCMHAELTLAERHSTDEFLHEKQSGRLMQADIVLLP